MPLVELPVVEEEDVGVPVVLGEDVVVGRDLTGLEEVPDVPPDVVPTPLTWPRRLLAARIAVMKNAVRFINI